MKSRFHLDAFNVAYRQPEKTGSYYAFDKDGLSGDRFYDAENKEWSSDVEFWACAEPVNFSEDEIVEMAGFRSEFRQLEDVMFTDRGLTFYGWISKISFPDENTPAYDIEAIVAWKGEPFVGEPITFTLPNVSPDEVDLRKSDRKIP